MLVFFFREQQIFFRQIFDNLHIRRLGIFRGLHRKPAKPLANFRPHRPVHIHMLDKRQAFFLPKFHIILAKCRRDMHDTRPLLRIHKIRRIYFPAILAIRKFLIFGITIKQGFVGFSNKIRTLEFFHYSHLLNKFPIPYHSRRCYKTEFCLFIYIDSLKNIFRDNNIFVFHFFIFLKKFLVQKMNLHVFNIFSYCQSHIPR